jgi:ubiquinone/menaquinone biosynthesis C-methylase UbiE
MSHINQISKYWKNRHPGRKIAGNITEHENPKKFFELVDEYRFQVNHYRYLIDGTFFKHSEYAQKDILEIGCGLGADLQKFVESGSHVYAIDSVDVESTLRKRFNLIGKDFVFQQADFRNIPFPDSKFDLVYSFGVLHHSPWIEEGVREAARVLKPNGELIIMLYHKGFKYYLKKLFFRGVLQGQFLFKNKQEIINKHTEEFGESPTTLVYSRSEAIELVDAYFDVLETKVLRLDDNINIPFVGKVYPLRFLLPKKLYKWLESRFGWNLLIRAQVRN